jgi:hypothetical protein
MHACMYVYVCMYVPCRALGRYSTYFIGEGRLAPQARQTTRWTDFMQLPRPLWRAVAPYANWLSHPGAWELGFAGLGRTSQTPSSSCRRLLCLASKQRRQNAGPGEHWPCDVLGLNPRSGVGSNSIAALLFACISAKCPASGCAPGGSLACSWQPVQEPGVLAYAERCRRHPDASANALIPRGGLRRWRGMHLLTYLLTYLHISSEHPRDG